MLGDKSKKVILILLGLFLGAFFLYLSFRDVSWMELKNGMLEMKPVYLIPAFFLMLSVQLVRALRFRIIVSPFCNLSVKSSWHLLNIWAGAGSLLPARLGEFLRPYLLQQQGVSFTSSFGAVIVERFFDLSGLLLLLGIVLWRTPEIPHMYSWFGFLMLVMLLIGYAFILFALVHREKVDVWTAKILGLLPHKAAGFIGSLLKKLLDGFGIMSGLKKVIILFGYSVLLWLLFATLTYVFLTAFSINAPFLTAVTIQVFICFGVALPSAPGFIGTFHAACRYALALFGIQAIAAVSFATVYHIFTMVVNIGLTVYSYLAGNFRFDRALIFKSKESDSTIQIAESSGIRN